MLQVTSIGYKYWVKYSTNNGIFTKMVSLDRHGTNSVITGSTDGCHNDKLRRNQRNLKIKSHHTWYTAYLERYVHGLHFQYNDTITSALVRQSRGMQVTIDKNPLRTDLFQSHIDG